MQRVDLLPLDGGLEAEVEVREGLYGWKPARPHRGLQAAAVAKGDLSVQEALDRFGCGRASPVHTGEDLVQRLQGTGHLQVGQLGRDAFPA